MPFPTRVIAAAFMTAASLALPAHASAAPAYPPAGSESITVSTTSATAGASITVSAKTFESSSDVRVSTVLDGDAALVSSASLGGGRLGTALRTEVTGTCETGSECTVVASGTGVATATVKLTRSGPTNITMSGIGLDGEPLSQTVSVNVADLTVEPAGQQAPQAPATGLASTGPRDLVETLLIAFGMLAAGTTLVLAVRRRRDSLTPA